MCIIFIFTDIINISKKIFLKVLIFRMIYLDLYNKNHRISVVPDFLE